MTFPPLARQRGADIRGAQRSAVPATDLKLPADEGRSEIMARTQQGIVVGETFADRMSLSYTALCRQRHGQIRKLELTEFGQRIGARMLRPAVSPSTIMEWFAGEVPDVATIQAVAEVCGVDPGWLAFGSASGAPALKLGEGAPAGAPRDRRTPNGMLIKF